MYCMDVKFGKIRPNNNIFLSATASFTDENFFASTSDSKQQGKNNEDNPNRQTGNRINDYDSRLLEDNAYQGIEDELFKLEHRIGILEKNLTKINSEIEALESLGYEIQIYDLKSRKEALEQELISLNKEYSDMGLTAKISGQIASVVNFTSNKKTNSFSVFKKLVSKNVLSKISKKFDYSQTMKEALENLSNINLSVDELINMQVPYGETIKRYEKLTAYLNKANLIHSKISKNLNSIGEKTNKKG